MGNVQYLDYDDAVQGVINTSNRLITMVDALDVDNYTDFLP